VSDYYLFIVAPLAAVGRRMERVANNAQGGTASIYKRPARLDAAPIYLCHVPEHRDSNPLGRKVAVSDSGAAGYRTPTS
jgi:hypothetical protein